MTRTLSQLLGAHEPEFRQGLQLLDKASGGAAEDIRLTADIWHGVQDKLQVLGLDSHDTTGRELYAALMQRLQTDNQIFERLLGQPADNDREQPGMARIERFINSLDIPKEIFAIKLSVAKKLLRQIPPKKAMKRLGYRSLDSMLKHEPAGLLFAAAHIAESAQWRKSMLSSYKKLLPSDFESRPVQLIAPDSSRWRTLAGPYVAHTKHNTIAFRELGVVVLLPIAGYQIQGAPLAATLLALQAINDTRTSSTYLKLHQVRGDFGQVVAAIADGEPVTKAEIAGASLPWKLIQRYFAKHPTAYNPDLFEPHVQQTDLRWQTAEDVLAAAHPRFEFWQGAAHLGLVAPDDTSNKTANKIAANGEIISLNLIDMVLNFCNVMPYERRFVRYVREHIWHELLVRYLHQASIERTVHDQLSRELVGGIEVAE